MLLSLFAPCHCSRWCYCCSVFVVFVQASHRRIGAMNAPLAGVLLGLFNPGIGGGAPPMLWVLPAFVIMFAVLVLYLLLVELLVHLVPLLYTGIFYNICRPLHTVYLVGRACVGIAVGVSALQVVASMQLWALLLQGDSGFFLILLFIFPPMHFQHVVCEVLSVGAVFILGCNLLPGKLLITLAIFQLLRPTLGKRARGDMETPAVRRRLRGKQPPWPTRELQLAELPFEFLKHYYYYCYYYYYYYYY